MCRIQPKPPNWIPFHDTKKATNQCGLWLLKMGDEGTHDPGPQVLVFNDLRQPPTCLSDTLSEHSLAPSSPTSTYLSALFVSSCGKKSKNARRDLIFFCVLCGRSDGNSGALGRNFGRIIICDNRVTPRHFASNRQ